VEGQIVIDRPISEVFEFVADQRNEPQYNPLMRLSEKITDGPIGVGTRFRADSLSMGRRVAMTIEFTEFEPPYRLAEEVKMSAMDLSGSIAFDSVERGP
jgi:uncharacterized protein YndB with AHSA1/START domain